MNYASLKERIRFGGKTLLRSSNVDNDDEKHHLELLRHSEMKNRKVEPTMKRIVEAGKILGKDLWVRAHSKETPLSDLKDRLRRLR